MIPDVLSSCEMTDVQAARSDEVSLFGCETSTICFCISTLLAEGMTLHEKSSLLSYAQDSFGLAI